MYAQPESEEVLICRMLPACNPDPHDRAHAWADWQLGVGEQSVHRYVRAHNGTFETDEDIVQDALLTAYLSVEGGRYQPQPGIPFTAYVVGIARNKIREARRRMHRYVDLDEEREEEALALSTVRSVGALAGDDQRQPEHSLERREQRYEQQHLLYSGLQQLPTARRMVLEQYLAGASTTEIADRLAISTELVRQHKCRGLRALQQRLQSNGLLGQAA